MRNLRFLLVVAALLPLAGCLDSETVVRVRTDGSGVVREQVLINKTFAQTMRAMGEALGQLGAPPSTGFQILDEAALRKKAMTMGEGVYFISAKPVVTDAGEGYRAYFGFQDVDHLRIDQNPGDKVPAAGMEGVTPTVPQQSEYVRFELIRGEPAELIVRLPGAGAGPLAGSAGGSKSPPVGDARTQAGTAQVKQFLNGLRIAMAVEVYGSIVETNATHRLGDRVTLMEMDFAKLLEMPQKLAELSRRQPQGIEAAKALLKGIPGFSMELNPEVRIRFEADRGIRI